MCLQVRKDIVELCEELGAIPGLDILAMTTNGIALKRKLPKLKAAGLTHLNISLDTMLDHKFQLLTRRAQGKERVLENIYSAVDMGFHTKVNCVMMRGVNDEELTDFVAMTKEHPIDVRFIEYMPFGGNKWQKKKMMSYIEMIDRIRQDDRFESLAKAYNEPNDTARSYKVEGHEGAVSFITSMSHSFCSSCNRLRVTADGNLKVCLFGNTEVSLRDAIREGNSDEDLATIIQAAVQRKKKAHAGMDELAEMENRPMILIGG